MKITANLYDVLSQKKSTQILEIPENITVAEFLAIQQITGSYISLKYYPVRDGYSDNDPVFPYILRKGQLIWRAGYREVLLREFFDTHNITDGKIEVLCSVPQAGGPDLFDIVKMWQDFYRGLETLVTLSSVSILLRTFIKWLAKKNKWRGWRSRPPKGLETISPGAVFSFILKRDYWNHNELSALLKVKPEEAREMLKLCGYRWDRQNLQYVKTATTKEVLRKLNNVPWSEHR